jgi:hypothetical protein
MGEKMKPSTVIYAYAGFLTICALGAYAISGFASLTALIPVGMAVIMVPVGWLAGRQDRTSSDIGTYVGIVLVLLYALMFAERGYRQFAAEETVMYLAVTFVVLFLGSLVALVAIVLTRPKSGRADNVTTDVKNAPDSQ